jgi:hypothetical protein
VYIDSNRHDTLRYEFRLARRCHLIVFLVVLSDDLEDGYGYVYHDDYWITLIMLLIILIMLALCML